MIVIDGLIKQIALFFWYTVSSVFQNTNFYLVCQFNIVQSCLARLLSIIEMLSYMVFSICLITATYTLVTN